MGDIAYDDDAVEAVDIEKHIPNGSVGTPKINNKDPTHLLEEKIPEKFEDAEGPLAIAPKKKFPKSVFFIVGNEFCERFSYYGMRTVLSIYMTSILGMEQTTATAVYHSFVMICYFMPVLGSMLADSYLGKFRTIFYVSLIYALGNIVLSLTAMPPLHFPLIPMSMVGLFLISLGTGGIKPCVSAFGGDQFDNDQISQREKFFFIFYFSINAGSLISTFVTPLLKDDVKCFGQDSCYSLAFGLPAILMICSVIIFVLGKRLYRILPPKENILVKVSKCIGHAISRKWNKPKGDSRDHWLDYADDRFDKKFISDVRAALRVMYLYLPLPIFWALFEQQGSLWTFQAQELDGRLTSSYTILPEQMQVVNPLLILIFIPIFESGVYPLLAKCNLFKKPLPRMFVGGLFAALAFYIAGFLQMQIESKFPTNPSFGQTDLIFINNGPCSMRLESVNQTAFPLNVTLENGANNFYSENLSIPIGDFKTLPIMVTPFGDSCKDVASDTFNVATESGTAFIVAFIVGNDKVNIFQQAQLREKPADGNATFRLVYNLKQPGNQVMFKKSDSETKCIFNVNPISGMGITSDDENLVTSDDYCSTAPGTYYLHLPNGTEDDSWIYTGISINPINGGQYDYNLYTNGTEDDQIFLSKYTEVPENDVKMLYQVPQYVIITAGEIMFSITGLEFSYSQAPASMKSVLQAAWLLTDAFGNLIIIIISEIPMFDLQSYEYFLYACIMVVVMFLFAYMCMGYVYVTIDSAGNVIYPEGKEFKKKKKAANGKANGGYNDELDNSEM